jgi:hypothetical protein
MDFVHHTANQPAAALHQHQHMVALEALDATLQTGQLSAAETQVAQARRRAMWVRLRAENLLRAARELRG